MRLITRWVVGLALMLALAGCTMGGGDGTRAPSPGATSGPPIDSVSAFQSFSGLTVPARADGVTVNATVDAAGQSSYRVGFSLPTAELDRFCQDGQMNRPLRVRTIPASVRTTLDYQGDGATGVAVAEASLPSTRIQREVLAVGTARCWPWEQRPRPRRSRSTRTRFPADTPGRTGFPAAATGDRGSR